MAGSPRRLVAAIAACVVVLMLLSVGISKYHTWAKSRDADQEQRYREALSAAASLQIRYDSAVKASKIDSTRLDSLKASSAALKRQIDSRADSARLKGVQIDRQPLPEFVTDPRWKELYLQRTAQNAMNEAVIDMYERLHANDTTALRLSAGMTQRWEGIAHTAVLTVVPNLVNVAAEQHDRRDCFILRILPCPSRKVVAVVATATGAVLGAVVAGRSK